MPKQVHPMRRVIYPTSSRESRNEETLIVYKNRLVLLEGRPSAAIKELHPPVG